MEHAQITLECSFNRVYMYVGRDIYTRALAHKGKLHLSVTVSDVCMVNTLQLKLVNKAIEWSDSHSANVRMKHQDVRLS